MHHWTEQELWTVCVCYMEGLSTELALRLTNTTDLKSMEMRYRNCLYLEKGDVDGSLSRPSKKHIEAWEGVRELYNHVSPVPKQEVYVSDGLSVVLGILIVLNIVKLLA